MSTIPDLTSAIWKKSSYSEGNSGQCVEFARNLVPSSDTVPVRDSKHPSGPTLLFPASAWSTFIANVRKR
ncbi:DUF397 domain-containing protein [Streptomyces sp. I05A-00742]|uniref:DUF397 domain-containing protein n=1 Tax=Streptomyces sp. I05A-00742 TaxID=2732853 RepID=UPI001488DE4D|nr:DUF397 domain-containing protein [Streptomyces sp. I05A-00742]